MKYIKYIVTGFICGISCALFKYIDIKLNLNSKFKDKKLIYFFIMLTILFSMIFILLEIKNKLIMLFHNFNIVPLI
ncbi:hypothetical protein [Clostridium lundense]|uniref:hypothetical protein n=1 Tax=Clostridium lundense TaxID=319475 RepID=UPI000484485F|nr:hypothetical protein [Clostridium lundense]